MRKISVFWIAMLLVAALLAGCAPVANPETTPTEDPTTAETEAPTVVPTETPTEAPTEAEVHYEGDASSYYIDVVYTEQIERYHTALAEKWDEEKYFDNNMSELPVSYYNGNPLNNVGFGFVDLDNDGRWELIIGAILNAEKDPAVFEIWTQVDGKPVMLAQGGSRNRYVLEYVEEDNMWYVVNEATNGAASSATYYMMLLEGELKVMQGILFDAEADAENPWFMTYDMDWDVSNDEPIDEDMANAILNTNRSHYTALELFPYILYQ